MKTIRCCFVLFLLFAVPLSPGCSRSGLSGLVVCKGTVTLDSKPVEGAVVTLIPNREAVEEGRVPRNAFGTTDASGRFVMTTLKENDGVLPGRYFAIVTKYEPGGIRVQLPEIDSETGEHMTFEPPVNRLPAVYENYRQSNLEVTVPSKGVKDLVLELTSPQAI